MRKLVLGCAMMLSVAGASTAADLTTYESYEQQTVFNPAPIENWTGFFAGGLFGGAGGSFNSNVPTNPGPTGDAGNVTFGGTIGYNHQLGPNWAVGVEADLSWIDIDATSAAGRFEEDWMATVRARGGYTFSRYFAYVTAGVGFTHAEATLTGVGSASKTITGFTGGVGLEGKINEKLSAKVEYLYVDVPTTNFNVGGTTVRGGSNNHIGRVGINYHF